MLLGKSIKVLHKGGSRNIRKGKAQFEMQLASDVKGNKKVLYTFVKSKRNTKETICLLQNAEGSLVPSNEETTEIFHDFLVPSLQIGSATRRQVLLAAKIGKKTSNLEQWQNRLCIRETTSRMGYTLRY